MPITLPLSRKLVRDGLTPGVMDRIDDWRRTNPDNKVQKIYQLGKGGSQEYRVEVRVDMVAEAGEAAHAGNGVPHAQVSHIKHSLKPNDDLKGDQALSLTEEEILEVLNTNVFPQRVMEFVIREVETMTGIADGYYSTEDLTLLR